MTDYQPIDCGLHSQYELWIMQQQRLDIHWYDSDKNPCHDIVTATDLLTRQGEEFLVMETQGGQVEIRLDRIIAAAPA